MYLKGISTEYYSYSGDLVPVPWQDREQLLREMGDDPGNTSAIEDAVFDLDAKPWQSWLQSLHVICKPSREYIDVRFSPDTLDQLFRWCIKTESGSSLEGDFRPVNLEEVGNYYIDNIRYTARRLYLADLPAGYHQVVIENSDHQQQASLIVAPDSCYTSERQDKKYWGINCQLYTLRSKRNWGIGDFTDLSELIEYGATAGMDLISLNPVHAPYMGKMDIASPYSPSDRRFLNPLYIDPTAVPEFTDSTGQFHESRTVSYQKISDLRALDLIDYDEVARLKYSVFDQMFQYFLDNQIKKATHRAAEFNKFTMAKGQLLTEFAQYESKNFGFELDSADDPVFHQYLQWLAQEQMSACQQLAKQLGMRIGLMKDLAVGAVREGAEIQSNPGLYCKQATIGAPPDPMALQGQDWNLPALDPIALKNSNYKHFIDLLRANMHSCGGLRIDHILGFLRLWWCLPDVETGAYVYYPMDDLMAILCLESQRNRCLVVGEDMGTVPDELRTAMATKSIFGNKVFYFEKHHNDVFKSPQSHKSDAMLMVTNHDVPTLAGWWQMTDLTIRKQIGLINAEHEFNDMQKHRQHEKRELLNWLQSQQLIPEAWNDSSLENGFDFDLCSAILVACARSQSEIMLFQLDDLQLLQTPVNIPGTYREYPNWCRKQEKTTQSLFNNSDVQALLSTIRKERMQ